MIDPGQMAQQGGPPQTLGLAGPPSPHQAKVKGHKVHGHGRKGKKGHKK